MTSALKQLAASQNRVAPMLLQSVSGETAVVFASSAADLRSYGDVLIPPDGTVLAAHRGRHADDQWCVEDLPALAIALSSGQDR